MEAVQHYFKTIERTENPQLIIDLPEGVDKAEVEVTIRPLHDKPADEPKPSRLTILQQFKGTMSSDYDPDQYDVYDQ